jgi:hypothetical protein
MLVLSIDVGIKNLSLCLFEIEGFNEIKIVKWDNLNLCEKIEMNCVEVDKNGLCGKSGKFVKNGACYCLKHSKKYEYLHPTQELNVAYLNKQKIQKLLEIADKYNISYTNPNINLKKSQLLDIISVFVKDKCYEAVEKVNAPTVSLVTIGKNIQHKFDELLEDHIANIQTIIIENQIGPLANKMKTIQGMISQYFIMKNNDINIEFISASNKLKDFMPKKGDKNVSEKLDYKQRKKLGVQTCLEIVSLDHRFKEWENFFNKHAKKDDLSDCFLQGMWYIKHKLILS